MNVNNSYGQFSSSGAPTYGSSTFNTTQNPHITMSMSSIPTEAGLVVTQQRLSKRTFDSSTSPIIAAAGKRMRSKDLLETSDAQGISTDSYDWIEDAGIEAIAKNFREKTRDLAKMVGRNIQEIRHKAYRKVLQASPTPAPAELDMPPTSFRPSTPVPVKLPPQQPSRYRK